MSLRRAPLLAAAALLAVAAPAPAGPTPPPSPTHIDWSDDAELVVSPDGSNVYAAGSTTMSFARNQETGALTAIGHSEPGGVAIAISPDGRFVYVGFNAYSAGAGIYILARDPQSGLLTEQAMFKGDGHNVTLGPVAHVAISPDGRFLYVSQTGDDAVHVFARDPQTGAIVWLQSLYGGPGGADVPDDALGMALSPDGHTLYLSGQGIEGFARNADTGLLSPLQHVQLSSTAFAVTVSRDGRRVYAGMGDYSVLDRDPDTGLLTLRGYVQLNDQSAGLCGWCEEGRAILGFPDNDFVLSSDPLNDRVFEARVTSDGVVLDRQYKDGSDGITGFANPRAFAWSPDGSFLYVTVGRWMTHDYRSSMAQNAGVAAFARSGGALRFAGLVSPGWERALTQSPSVAIDAGALYTNDPAVTVTVSPAFGVASYRVSNDGLTWSPAIRIEGTQQLPWHLDDSIGARMVKHVYVHFTETNFPSPLDFSDDIILDRVAPIVTVARVTRRGAGRRVRIAARDDRSGVAKLDLRVGRKLSTRRYAKRFEVRAPGRISVRAVDGAGNRSRWRIAR